MSQGLAPRWTCGVAVLLFLLAQAALFPLIQLTSADISSLSSYASILLVFLFALFTVGKGDGRGFVRLGILFTLVADYYLVIAEDAYLEGVFAFLLTQTAYFLHLLIKERRGGVRFLNVLTRVAFSTIFMLVACAILGESADRLAIVSVVYYANLLTNLIFALAIGKGERIFSLGLILFAMCDLCIGLETLFTSYLSSDLFGFMYGENINLPWVFYQPSQVLIGLRLLPKVKKTSL